MKNINPGLYRHFKGNNYQIITTVTDTENETSFVLYTAESDNENTLWVRPAELFFEKVDTSHGIQSRFRYLRGFNQEEKRLLKQQLFLNDK